MLKFFYFISEEKKSIFVDMIHGGVFSFPSWVTTIGADDGNGLRTSSCDFVFQNTTISIATNREVQLRDCGEIVERVKISDIFPNKEVVMSTLGDRIDVISPIFDNEKEMREYLCFVKYAYPQGYEDTVKLAEFLYQNNPEKKD